MASPVHMHIVHPGGRMHCYSYLLVGPEGAVLIDPGQGSEDARVLENIRNAGFPAELLQHALLTHCHTDHALGAYRFRNRGCQLYATPYTADVLRHGGHQVWYEFPNYVVPTEVDHEVHDSERLLLAGIDILVLATPGHTPGCASFLVETDEGLTAFTGDLICDNYHPGFAGSEGFSVEDSLASVEKLLAHKPDRAFWGHGPIDEPACDWLQHSLALGRAGKWKINTELTYDPVVITGLEPYRK